MGRHSGGNKPIWDMSLAHKLMAIIVAGFALWVLYMLISHGIITLGGGTDNPVQK